MLEATAAEVVVLETLVPADWVEAVWEAVVVVAEAELDCGMTSR